jgi:hypothetical protein
VQAEEELVEIALLRYAQQRAAEWGAERFAAEFARRELEERWLEAAGRGTTPYTPEPVEEEAPSMLTGPVDATAHGNAVGDERTVVQMRRSTYARHPSVPRPPEPDPEERGRRGRRRRRERGATAPVSAITPGEAARMSAAGRRLYGLDEPA